VDEAHNYRHVKKRYWAVFALRERSETVVAMTATPAIGNPAVSTISFCLPSILFSFNFIEFDECPQDLWNLGRYLGMPEFGSGKDKEAQKMERRLRSAQTQDRQRLKKGDRAIRIVQAAVKGSSGPQMQSLYNKEMMKWIGLIRKHFTGVVIRRTLSSVDNNGNRISGLGPLQEHHLIVTLYAHEIKNLEELAQDLVKDGTQGAAKAVAGHVHPIFPSRYSKILTAFYVPSSTFTFISAKLCCTQVAMQTTNGRTLPLSKNGFGTPRRSFSFWCRSFNGI